MNDYLFNTSGEADDEIKELETLLGELNFKPRPLDLEVLGKVTRINPSATFNFAAKRYAPTLLAAAVFVFTFAVTGVWFSWFMLRSQIVVQSTQTNHPSPAPTSAAVKTQSSHATVAAISASVNDDLSPAHKRLRSHPPRVSLHVERQRHEKSARRAQPVSARREGSDSSQNEAQSQRAAEDLLLALRIAGDKLYRTQRHLEARFSSALTGENAPHTAP